jgi:hypothetical protein
MQRSRELSFVGVRGQPESAVFGRWQFTGEFWAGPDASHLNAELCEGTVLLVRDSPTRLAEFVKWIHMVDEPSHDEAVL